MKRKIGIVAIAIAAVSATLWIAQSSRIALAAEPDQPTVEYLPDFTLPDLEDQPRSIAEWSERPLLINFWATWCAPCRREMPLLQNLQNKHGDDRLQVIGVALDNRRDAKKFVTEVGITYPNLYGEHEAAVVAESFGSGFVALPFSAFIAPDGRIVSLKLGELHADELEQLVAELLETGGQ